MSPGSAVTVIITRPDDARTWTTQGSGGSTLMWIALSAVSGARVSISVEFTTRDTHRSVPLTTPMPIGSGDVDSSVAVDPVVAGAPHPARANRASRRTAALITSIGRPRACTGSIASTLRRRSGAGTGLHFRSVRPVELDTGAVGECAPISLDGMLPQVRLDRARCGVGPDGYLLSVR